MDATQGATPSISCQTCGALNPAFARFCRACQAPLHVQPFPPPLPPPTFQASLSSIGGWPEAMIQADAQAAFILALERVQTAGVTSCHRYRPARSASQSPRRVAAMRRFRVHRTGGAYVSPPRDQADGCKHLRRIVISLLAVVVAGAVFTRVGSLVCLVLSAYFLWRVIGPGPRQVAASIMSSLTQETSAF